MEIKYGKGKTEYGPGVEIILSDEEVATAIEAFLVSHDVNIEGPRTIRINGDKIQSGYVYIDPAGSIVYRGVRYSGRGVK